MEAKEIGKDVSMNQTERRAGTAFYRPAESARAKEGK